MEDQPKLRILFVDDEPAMLEMLPRLLAELRDDWQTEFAESAAKGLELLARTPFDVVVSDLVMLDVSGIEFLREVRERYPLAARIIYSSSSDQASILECVGEIHQFLPKPCPRELLVATLQRAAMIRSLLPNSAIREKVSKIERIPSMPTLYLELLRQLQPPEKAIEHIAKTISQDIGMTAQILKIANSAFFGLPQPTSSVAEAIRHIGIETVKYLVLAVGVFSQFESRKLGGISLETLWHHSARTSNAAKLIAKSEAAANRLAEDALAAGLLHDVGKLILASNYPEQYEEIGRSAQMRQVEWLLAEREAFGFGHDDVGGYFLGLWGLPEAIVEAVAFHHFPTRSGQTTFTALTAVHVANVLVQTQRLSHGGIVPSQVDVLYLAKIGRVNALDHWREELDEAPTI